MLNRIRAMLNDMENRINNWLRLNQDDINRTSRRITRRLDRITDNFIRMMIIGLILNVVASSFYPELPERFPTIFGWFDGFLQLGEFALKVGLKVIYALFTGHLGEFWDEYKDAFDSMWHQFCDWLANISF